MRLRPVYLLVCTGLVLLPFDSNAELVDNGSYTTDTRTNLDWLDLTETVNRTFAYVDSQLGTGGEFEGWEYADIWDIEGLFDSAGGTGPYDGWSTANEGVVADLLALWGETNSGGDYIDSQFVTGDYDHSMPGWRYWGRVNDQNNDPFGDYLQPWQGSTSPANSGPWLGHALIRSAPEPSATTLLGSGILALLMFRARRRRLDDRGPRNQRGWHRGVHLGRGAWHARNRLASNGAGDTPLESPAYGPVSH
jgi:hypothetical protein